nr:S8 family serine peptidase [Nitrospinaceae bacterium]NIR53843.1 S8 family serine peptidase [Nitrospinaceae bacterium]NIS84254.1 S8 family serine peptidase [Nitrospinaceae bacterium]NIT81058.1 S8 family serine peptidase [Nitrospinaceae bacterium]NIU43349.1 S8 family serine peptidase [Nitrospinaceae bacterium]
MIHLRTWIGWFTLIAFGIAGGSAFAQPDDLVQVPGREAVEEARGSFIFVFDPAQIDGADAVPGLAQRLTAQAGGVLRHVYTTAIWGFSATLPQPAAERLAEQNPNIQYVEPNGVVWAIAPAAPAEKPDSPPGQDKKKSDDDGSSEPAQVLPYGIARVGGPVDGSGLTAWVIDTGIDLDHPDLNVGSRGANFVLRGKKSEDDGHGHGTHVSGTIAALDNTIDVVGVAAGATVEPVRVLDNSGSGTVDGVVAGIDHAAANGSPGDC